MARFILMLIFMSSATLVHAGPGVSGGDGVDVTNFRCEMRTSTGEMRWIMAAHIGEDIFSEKSQIMLSWMGVAPSDRGTWTSVAPASLVDTGHGIELTYKNSDMELRIDYSDSTRIQTGYLTTSKAVGYEFTNVQLKCLLP